jgi:hypothetical protein
VKSRARHHVPSCQKAPDADIYNNVRRFFLTDKRGTLLQGARKPLTQHDRTRQTPRTGSRADWADRLERLGINGANFYCAR